MLGGGWRISGADELGSGDSGVELELSEGGVNVANVRRPLKREIGRNMARRDRAKAIFLEIFFWLGNDKKIGELNKNLLEFEVTLLNLVRLGCKQEIDSRER